LPKPGGPNGGPASLSPSSGWPSPHTLGALGGVTPVCAGKHDVSVSRQLVIAAVVVADCKQALKAVKQSTALACVAVAAVAAELSRLELALLPPPDVQPAKIKIARLDNAGRESVLRMRSSISDGHDGFPCLVPSCREVMKRARYCTGSDGKSPHSLAACSRCPS
jgi:hypothetical protein